MTDFELLRDLRGMRQPTAPESDLWPAIATRIATPGEVARSPRRMMWPEAMAASVVLGLGLLLSIGTGEHMPATGMDAPATASAAMPWSLREAVALDAAYAGALEEARRSAPPPARELVRAEREIDAAQRALEDALAQQPDAVHLLDLLRRTHEQRLRLAQRHARTG